MADYKIKSNLNLYGNSINNFAIQADSGFPASPIMGRTQFYTGGGEYANHIVVYDGKSWKAVAYTDDVKNNADFINLKARVDAFLDGGVNSNDVLDNLREIQQFLDTYGDTTKLVDLLGEINEDIAEQADRISDLESKATQVSVSQTITAGKEIGKVTIDGNTTKLYAPANYNWNEIEGTPRTLDGYGILDGVMYKGVSGANASGASWMGYTYNTTEHGGAVAGGVIQAGGENNAFQLNGGYEGNALYYRGKNSGVFTDWRKIALADEVLPLSGGTIAGQLTISSADWASQLILKGINQQVGIKFQKDNTHLGYLVVNEAKKLLWQPADTAYAVIHEGNIAEQSVAFASNAGSVNGYKVTSSESPFGTIPLIRKDGVMEVGRFLDFHYDNTTASDFSTRLYTSGNNNAEIGLPSASGTLALLTDTVAAAYKVVTEAGDNVVHVASGAVYIGAGTYSTLATNIMGKNIAMRYGTSGTFGFFLNDKGNVTIGSEDMAGSSCKLYVDGSIVTSGNLMLSLGRSIVNPSGQSVLLIDEGGNVQIANGITDKKTLINGNSITLRYGGDRKVGFTLDKNGATFDVVTTFNKGVFAGTSVFFGTEGIYLGSNYLSWHKDGEWQSSILRFTNNSLTAYCSAIFDNGATINGKLYANAGADITGDVYVDGNVHITGNLFAEKELGGGGVGTPATGGGTGGGSAASGLFAVKRISEGVQSITLNHGLDTRNLVICIYEKDENALTEQWNMCLTDVEIISEMEIRVSFGSATTTEHKVVIMGAA